MSVIVEHRATIESDLVEIIKNGNTLAVSYGCLDYVHQHAMDEAMVDRILTWSGEIVSKHFANPEGTEGKHFYAALVTGPVDSPFLLACMNPAAVSVVHFIISKYDFPITDEQDNEEDAVFSAVLLLDAKGTIVGCVSEESPDEFFMKSTVH